MVALPFCLAEYHRNIMPHSLASLSVPHTMWCFPWGRCKWEPKPLHHYPCTRCHILWPFITTQASNESLLVSWSPDIRVKHLRYALGQLLLHAHVGITILDPEQREKRFLSRKWMKIIFIFSFANVIIRGEGKGRPPKVEAHPPHENNVGNYFQFENF